MYEASDTRYCYPGTTILKNRANQRTQIDLDKFEAFCVSRRMTERVPRGRMDAAHYRAIHRHLFSDVYSWAGRYREISIAKGGSEFCQPEYINTQMEHLFESLTGENCFRDLEPEVFAKKSGNLRIHVERNPPLSRRKWSNSEFILGIAR
jgi:cell filamentation protein